MQDDQLLLFARQGGDGEGHLVEQLLILHCLRREEFTIDSLRQFIGDCRVLDRDLTEEPEIEGEDEDDLYRIDEDDEDLYFIEDEE